MDPAAELKDFLMTRRARLSPEQVGLASSTRRRVPGLRREEVARLAGVSSEYYIQIERGRLGRISDEILLAIANALRLNATEQSHLFALAHAAGHRPTPRRRTRHAPHRVPDTIVALIERIDAPTVIQNPCLDILAANSLGRALYRDVLASTSEVPNLAMFVFLAPEAPEILPD